MEKFLDIKRVFFSAFISYFLKFLVIFDVYDIKE